VVARSTESSTWGDPKREKGVVGKKYIGEKKDLLS